MTNRSVFSAAEQGLGYIYQPRFALLKILSLPEDTALLIEKEDDIEFVERNGARSLGSLKHKAPGDTITDLSTDFWKSVRVWLAHYLKTERVLSNSRFLLFTTSTVAEGSFLTRFREGAPEDNSRADAAHAAIEKSKSQAIINIRNELAILDEDERTDFYNRITIVDDTPRIQDIPGEIDRLLRTVKRQSRLPLFERLEGWWMDLVIRLMTGERQNPIHGYEVSDKLSALAEEYRADNLPITFRNKFPDGNIDAANDARIFVEQLRMLKVSTERIRSAIVDYYRAFEQRSSWAREDLLEGNEIEEYEDRLVEEWARYRDVIFESLNDGSAEDVCLAAGKELYKWAELQTSSLRIRERVTEPYVVRGAFHILANIRPQPRVHWHPRFFQRLKELLEKAA